MTDINLKTLTPDTSLPTTGFLFGADSQASTNPSVYSTQTVATTLLGSTSLTGDTLTASAPVLNLTQTWNNGAVAFTGIKFNAAGTSDANSLLASFLMDIQVGSVTQFSIRKDGFFKTQGGLEAGVSGVGNIAISNNVSSFFLGTSFDTILSRKAAGNFRLGNFDAASPVAQTLSVQSIVGGVSTDASAAAYPFTITGAQGTGTGAGGSIVFKVAPAGGSGTAQNSLQTALTIDSTKLATFAGNVFASDLRCDYLRANGFVQLGSSSGCYISGPANDTFRFNSIAGLTVDLTVEANNTFALRNGFNAQQFRVYNTYTSSTSFERYSIDWITTANLAIVGPNKGSGGGTQRVQRLSYLEDGGVGSTVPLLGSTCPAASGTLKSWIKIITSDGTTAYIPCWA